MPVKGERCGSFFARGLPAEPSFLFSSGFRMQNPFPGWVRAKRLRLTLEKRKQTLCSRLGNFLRKVVS